MLRPGLERERELGLAWQDLELDAGVVALRRGATYADGVGMMLGPTSSIAYNSPVDHEAMFSRHGDGIAA